MRVEKHKRPWGKLSFSFISGFLFSSGGIHAVQQQMASSSELMQTAKNALPSFAVGYLSCLAFVSQPCASRPYPEILCKKKNSKACQVPPELALRFIWFWSYAISKQEKKKPL
ncbi:hypothetical protein BGZ63DRAFT_260349 [Mariannaea sp. PMI_226]|nr:hypothetical protein BGZ63DRAFT_260349 [Mariannaea sp. PMI_226]